MRTPNFIYIGPHKTGSTWLFHNFKNHPDIFVPDIKYTNYFISFPDRPLSWYLSHFESASPSHRVVGEFGISYLKRPNAVARLFELNSNMKFIYFFRDVIDQRISEMFHLARSTNESPYEIMDRLAARIENSDCNSRQLQEWIQRFGREQFLFAKFDRIKDEPEALLAEVYRFLGVSVLPPVPLTSLGENRRQAPRNVQFGRVARHVADRLRQIGMYGTLTRLKHDERVRRLIFREVSSEDVAALIAELRERYGPVFAEEQRRLETVTGLEPKRVDSTEINTYQFTGESA